MFLFYQTCINSNNSTHPHDRSAGAEVFHYSGMVDAFRTIVRTEGFRGLFRGIDAAVPRVMVGSAAQLSSYSSCKVTITDKDRCHTTVHHVLLMLL
jgi:Mitochondrial carrier protein